MINHALLLIAVISLFSALEAGEVKAANLDQACFKLGATIVSDDQQNMMACLYDSSHNLVWKGLAQSDSVEAVTTTNGTAPMLSVQDNVRTQSPPTHWQGWYIGADIGAASTNNSYVLEDGYSYNNLNNYGETIGLVGGYNVIHRSGLFYGGEADVSYIDNSMTSHYDGTISSFKTAWHGDATLRGRIGMAFDPALVFLTGGLALIDSSHEWNNNYYYTPGYYGFSSATIHPGWTLGAGADFALTNNISLSAQYLRLQVPEYSKTAPPVNFAGATPVKFLIDDSANILRVGVNWHFD